MEQEFSFLQLSWRAPSPCSGHTYPSVPRNGGLAQSHQGLSLKGTKLWLRIVMSRVLEVQFYRYLFFLLFIFVVNGDFKAKTYLLSSINSLLKVPWSWKGENFLFLPNAHPPAGPGQTWEAAVLLLGSCWLEGDMTSLWWHKSPCGVPDFCCCPKPPERRLLLRSLF